MKRILFILTVLGTFSCSGDIGDQREINADVWHPLRQSLRDYDTTLHASLYSSLTERKERRDLALHKYACYPARVFAGLKADISNHAKFDLEIRFLRRISMNDRAYEIGYYKCKFIFADGTEVISYSKFQATLTKENGQWNILTDSILPVTLTETDFMRATPLND